MKNFFVLLVVLFLAQGANADHYCRVEKGVEQYEIFNVPGSDYYSGSGILTFYKNGSRYFNKSFKDICSSRTERGETGNLLFVNSCDEDPIYSGRGNVENGYHFGTMKDVITGKGYGWIRYVDPNSHMETQIVSLTECAIYK